jgi:hypothetical protein
MDPLNNVKMPIKTDYLFLNIQSSTLTTTQVAHLDCEHASNQMPTYPTPMPTDLSRHAIKQALSRRPNVD